MMPIPEFDRKICEIRRTIDRDILPNEIFISFVNDEDAIWFDDWFRNEGLIAFEAWKHQEELD